MNTIEIQPSTSSKTTTVNKEDPFDVIEAPKAKPPPLPPRPGAPPPLPPRPNVPPRPDLPPQIEKSVETAQDPSQTTHNPPQRPPPFPQQCVAENGSVKTASVSEKPQTLNVKQNTSGSTTPGSRTEQQVNRTFLYQELISKFLLPVHLPISSISGSLQ